MTRTAAALALAAMFVAPGCSTYDEDEYRSNGVTVHHEEYAPDKVSIHLESAPREVIVGDTVTFIAHTTDTFGRNVKVNWSSTAGEVQTDEGGRIARVKFNDAGTYSVKATLELDGRPVQSDMAEVRVRPAK